MAEFYFPRVTKSTDRYITSIFFFQFKPESIFILSRKKNYFVTQKLSNHYYYYYLFFIYKYEMYLAYFA